MINNLVLPNIRVFIYGELRKGGSIDFFMEGSTPMGLYCTKGQLKRTVASNLYMDLKEDKTIIGELHHVNYSCIQRINYLGEMPKEFPRRYELVLIPIWLYQETNNISLTKAKPMWTLSYNVFTEAKDANWDNKSVYNELGDFLEKERQKIIYPQDLINHIQTYNKPTEKQEAPNWSI